MTTHERRSLTLTPDEWRELEDFAAMFDCRPSQGSQTDKTSWRTLIKQIARGDIGLDTTPLSYVEPSTTSPAALRQQAIAQLNHTSLTTVQTYLDAMRTTADPPDTYTGIAPEVVLSVQAASEAEAIQALRVELIRQIEKDPDWIVITGWPAR